VKLVHLVGFIIKYTICISIDAYVSARHLVLTVLIKNSSIQCASVEVTLTAESFGYNVTEDSALIFLKLHLICTIYQVFIFL